METSSERVAQLLRAQRSLKDEYQMFQFIGGLNYTRYQQLNEQIKKNQKKLNFYTEKESYSQPSLTVADFLE